ncbi:MAG: hypothetical protein ACOCRK_10060 [bacterium]
MVQKLSDKSLKVLYNSLSPEAERTLKIIYENNGIIKSTLMDLINMTYARTGNAINELEHKLFIYRETSGNAWPIRVTNNGEYVLQQFIYNNSSQ